MNNEGEVTLGDLFSIKRGLATGSNSFFILDAEQIRDWHIPRQFLKPILPGPRYVAADIIDAHSNGDPAVSPRVYLLDCNEPEEEIKSRWPRFHEYLQKGHHENIATSYLASHRLPWYSQEKPSTGTFPLHLHGPCAQWQAPFPFSMEPFASDSAQRIPHAVPQE